MNGSAGNGIIRVAYLIDTIACDTAGTQKQLLETIARLDRKSFAPQLICLWRSEWMETHQLPCRCSVLGYRGFLKSSFPAVLRQLRSLLKEQRIDILQTFFVDSLFVGLFAALLLRPAPVLISSRRDIGLGERNRPWYHPLMTALLPLANRFFDGIIANSEEVRRHVSRHERVPLAKVRVVTNGLALPARSGEEPGLFGSDREALWIGMAASLTPVKRHDILLRAVALLQGRVATGIRVLLLGEGPLRDELEELTRTLGLTGRVHFPGAVRDVTSYLRRLDICVLCSDREGLSNALLEYMACGRPVVATAVGGNPGVISGDTGILVPAGDPEALAAALAQLAADRELRMAMGDAAREAVRRRYSWESSLSGLESCYRELAAMS